MEFDLENPLTGLEEHQSDTIPSLFASELDHMPSQNYITNSKTRDLDVSARQEAVSLILHFSCNLDQFVPYLAVNYFDRFISRQQMPQGKPWIVKLLSISCLSLAAKMRRTEFSITSFQKEEGFIFDTQTIRKMELVILGALKWRMRSITPFSFVYFFLSLFKLKDPPLKQALKARATEIIFKSQYEIKLLEFKPSIIAASALLSASYELFPFQFPCFRNAISSSVYVNKERFLDCCNVMESILTDSYESWSSDKPVNVHDLHCCCCNNNNNNNNNRSSQSEKSTITTTSSSLGIISTSVLMRSERDINKRRKISDFCCNNDKSFQISQIQQC